MKDHSCDVTASETNRFGEGVADQFGSHVAGHGQSQDPQRAQPIGHHGRDIVKCCGLGSWSGCDVLGAGLVGLTPFL